MPLSKIKTNSIADNAVDTNKIQITATSNPSSPAKGDVYYNTSENELRVYNGSAWVTSTDEINKDNAPSIMGDAYFWLPSENIVFGADGIVDRWDEENNNRDFTPDVANSSNSSNMYAYPFSNGYMAVSADDAYDGIGSYGPCLRYNTAAGFTYGDDWSAILVINHLGTGGQVYNDAFAAVNTSDGGGAWSIGPGKVHTWGGGYDEIPASGSNPYGTGVNFGKSIWLWRYTASGTVYQEYRWDVGSKSWLTTQNVSSAGAMPNVTYTSQTIGFFEHGSNTTHYARGHIAEYAFWSDTVLTDAQRDDIGMYLHNKFKIGD
jgi:hypothetical protein